VKKKLLIAGYPRSGNTWLGYLLSYILGARYEELHAPPDSKPTHQKEILALIQGKLPLKTTYQTVVKTHDRYNFHSPSFDLTEFDKTIYIVRDPRDVVVSLFFYRYYNSPIDQGKPQDILSRKPWFLRKYLWKRTVLEVAKEWPLHVISWLTYEGILLIRYSDLYKKPVSSLNKILRHLGVPLNKKRVATALKHFSFEKLTGGRKSGQEQATGFFRKGVIGDYQNHFDWLDRLIFRHFAKQEMQELGYKID
jgi:hypothetical protein